MTTLCILGYLKCDKYLFVHAQKAQSPGQREFVRFIAVLRGFHCEGKVSLYGLPKEGARNLWLNLIFTTVLQTHFYHVHGQPTYQSRLGFSGGGP